MSSDRETPLFTRRKQRPGYLTSTPDPAFRRPPEQQPLATPKSKYAGLSVKSKTSTPISSGSTQQSQWKSPSAHSSQEVGRHI